MKVHMVVFRLNGIVLLWQKTLLPLLNLAVNNVSWELFEGRFQERYVSKEFIECHLNKFDALQRSSRMVLDYEAHFGAASICSAPSYPET